MGTKTIPTIPIPKALMAASSVSAAYARLVKLALNEKLELKEVNIKGVPRKSINMPPVLEGMVEKIAKEHGIKFSVAFAGLTQAAINFLCKNIKFRNRDPLKIRLSKTLARSRSNTITL